MKPHLAAITARAEFVRRSEGLNKARFCAGFKPDAIKPQTYNNFIGAQGSKPNVELLLGVCEGYGISAEWLLRGEGPIARPKAAPPPDPELPTPEAGRPTAETGLPERIAALERDVAAIKGWFGSQWEQWVLPHYRGSGQRQGNGGEERTS